MTKTIEQEALDLINEVLVEFRLPQDVRLYRNTVPVHEALCRAFEQLRAEREAHAATKAEYEAFRQEVSEVAHVAMSIMDEMSKPLLMGRNVKDRLDKARKGLALLILPKPDPLVEALDAMLRRRTLNPAAEVVADEAAWLHAALAARGLKLVEAGDAD